MVSGWSSWDARPCSCGLTSTCKAALGTALNSTLCLMIGVAGQWPQLKTSGFKQEEPMQSQKFDPKVFQLGYVALGTPDIERAKQHYLQNLGMTEVAQGDDGSVYLSVGYNHQGCSTLSTESHMQQFSSS